MFMDWNTDKCINLYFGTWHYVDQKVKGGSYFPWLYILKRFEGRFGWYDPKANTTK